MTGFTDIDLAKLPHPTIIDRKDFETILSEVRAWLLARDPLLEFVLTLESEPINKVLEAWAYRETLLRAAFDDAGRGNMLAFATGAQLEHLAAFYGVTRLVLVEANLTANPPVVQEMESDDRLRTQVQLALEGFTTAGSRGSYVFWGLSASAMVKDIGVVSPTPGQVVVSVLSTVADGVPDAALLALVEKTLTDEDVRPLTDQVIVQPAEIVNYTVEAVLTLYEGPDAEIVRANAEAAVLAFTQLHQKLGHDITVSGLHGALHQEGVQNVSLVAPAGDLVILPNQAPFCTSITVTVGGRDV